VAGCDLAEGGGVADRPGQERLQAEPERLDLLQLLDGERGDPRAAARSADDEALALEPAERVPHRRQAHLEAAGELLERQPLSGRELEPADLGAERAVDPVLDGRDLEGSEHLIFDQSIFPARDAHVNASTASCGSARLPSVTPAIPARRPW
jgi:hypothetical protein